jgi:hypothetical protein
VNANNPLINPLNDCLADLRAGLLQPILYVQPLQRTPDGAHPADDDGRNDPNQTLGTDRDPPPTRPDPAGSSHGHMWPM